MKLISMTDYVLEQEAADISDETFIERVIDYAKFLKQPLELWMFVSCDEDGNVLKEPEHFDLWRKYGDFTQYETSITPKCRKYQQSKERVLFDGFEVVNKNDVLIFVENESFDIRFKKDGTIDSYRFRIIEHLAYRRPTLTQTAINQLK